MKVALVDIHSRKYVINKDLSAGFGTTSDYGNNLLSTLLISWKRNNVKIPILMFGYLARILQDNGHEVEIITTDNISNAELYIIFSSLIEHKSEIMFAKKIKQETKSKVCFVGSFATINPDIFTEYSDLVIVGEPEQALMEFKDNDIPTGLVFSKSIADLNSLPFPYWDPFDINSFKYSHYISSEKVFTTMITSRGCPYSCSYYCPYPSIQGKKYRKRSVNNVLDEIEYLISNYNVGGILFRDPIYTLDMQRSLAISKGMIERGLDIQWACETHLDKLDHNLIHTMFESGLKGINVGIESSNEKVLDTINRKYSRKSHMENIIKYSENLGIKIGAFYIIGNLTDTKESIIQTIEYAKYLNTAYAQFTISTPLPGTEFYEDINNRIIENNWENFDLYTPTFSHPTLSSMELQSLLEKAFSNYYLRYKWLAKYFKSFFKFQKK